MSSTIPLCIIAWALKLSRDRELLGAGRTLSWHDGFYNLD